jgi:hypothetical protein
MKKLLSVVRLVFLCQIGGKIVFLHPDLQMATSGAVGVT